MLTVLKTYQKSDKYSPQNKVRIVLNSEDFPGLPRDSGDHPYLESL
jgi:hypothetical protein